MLVPDYLHFALVLAALLGCGLIAGVFFAFSTFVMKALSRLTPEEGIKVMQSINITILNSCFLYVFFGTAFICVLLLVWSLFQWDQMSSGFIFSGSALYLAGSLMVTGIFNVPKNKALAKVDVSSTDSEELWNNYMSEWMIWNHIRTIASLSASTCFGVWLY